MGALSLLFAVQNIASVIRIARGESDNIEFDATCMWLLGIVISVKVGLFVACLCGRRRIAKSDAESLSTLQVYVKDHGFDVVQNALVFLGARIATIDNRLQIVDKVVSIIILGYIAISWI